MEVALLIYKKLTSKLTASETLRLSEWLEASDENWGIFKKIETFYRNGGDISGLTQLDADQAWEKVLEKQLAKKRKARTRHIIRTSYKYAAVLLIAFLAGYAYWNYNSSPEDIMDSNPKDEGVVIVFDNGEKIRLSSERKQEELLDQNGNRIGERNGDQLDYFGKENVTELVYNTLYVPNGRRFDIVLSDNSHVYLNAGSSLRYPVNFIPGKKRQVYLEGEAFFDVSKDKNHPFVVTSGNMDVEVLGTKFNVNAYPEETNINTVLVEGSVRLNTNEIEENRDASVLLEPGHMAQWDQKTKSAQTEEVDTELYTGWMQGKLVLKGMRFKDILKKLERHYGVSIQNKNKKLENRVFTATFDVETIEEVLNTFVAETNFDYLIEKEQITILE
ncbi:FecR domain-containing protein [Muricauda sp. ANG21]|uniref:FecR family protein n=1 Tax=Allomuricauda sp. ANG21 TaxID=3042468 RepID=UPI0034559681